MSMLLLLTFKNDFLNQFCLKYQILLNCAFNYLLWCVRGVGLLVNMFALYDNDPSSISAEIYNFCKNVVEKNENKQKRPGWTQYLIPLVC